ncbi:MAG: biosynthetic peptidoglycan transglycosylase, partial [Patescibacteria group bacterium]
MIKKHSVFNKFLFYGIFLFVAVFMAVLVVFFAFIFFVKTPNLTNLSERKVVQSTKIYDRTGEVLLYDIHGQQKRTVVTNDQIPDYVKNATIAVEDDTFYQHYGIRPLSLIRAFVFDLINRSREQGGSTITQQLVKQTLLTSDKTIIRKIKEIFLAIKVDRQYSKDQILNFYLNQIPYGAYAYGIEAASQTFLQKHVWELTPLEAAYMAALPNAPTYYSPCGKHKDALDART